MQPSMLFRAGVLPQRSAALVLLRAKAFQRSIGGLIQIIDCAHVLNSEDEDVPREFSIVISIIAMSKKINSYSFGQISLLIIHSNHNITSNYRLFFLVAAASPFQSDNIAVIYHWTRESVRHAWTNPMASWSSPRPERETTTKTAAKERKNQ